MRTTDDINHDIKSLIHQHPEVFEQYAMLVLEYLSAARDTALCLALKTSEDLQLIRLTKH